MNENYIYITDEQWNIQAARMSNLDKFSQTLIGKTKSECIESITEYPSTYRVLEEDGTCYSCTYDCIFDRINLYIKNDLIYKVHVG